MFDRTNVFVRKSFLAGLFGCLQVLSALAIITGLSGILILEEAARAEGPNAILNLPGCLTNIIAANDDSSSPRVTLPFTLNFVGKDYSSIFVNNNGNVTFDMVQSAWTPYDLRATSRVIIAPFFIDIDTRGAGSHPVTYGSTTYGSHAAFCANWVNVGYYSYHTDVLNSFQLLLIERFDTGPGNFDIMFNYDKINFESADSHIGKYARVGYSNGSDFSFELPGSGIGGSFLNVNKSSGLIHTSRDSLQLGRYIFPVRNGIAPSGGAISGKVYAISAAPGNILAGVNLQVCVANTCHTTTTTSTGTYTVAGLPAGTYFVEAFPPAGLSSLAPNSIGPLVLAADQVLNGQDIVLNAPIPLLAGTTITPSMTGNGFLHVFSIDPLTLTTIGCPGATASYQIFKGATLLRNGPMSESPLGTYNTAIPALSPNRGSASLVITLNCPSGGTTITPFDIYIDPSGLVKTISGTALEGATVTLFRSDIASGPYTQVPNLSGMMSPSNRKNPDTTNSSGRFSWDVIAGFYKVRAEKAGCSSPVNISQTFVETDAMQIPPPYTDLQLVLYCGGPLPPTAITVPATGVTASETILNGMVNPNGTSTSYYFQWGTSTSYESTTPTQSAGSGTNDANVSVPINGLTPNTTYHYRLVATSSVWTSNGEDQAFKTLVAPTPGNFLYLPLILR
jgi:hypothetical protein